VAKWSRSISTEIIMLRGYVVFLQKKKSPV
jgi:hypothetical protein